MFQGLVERITALSARFAVPVAGLIGIAALAAAALAVQRFSINTDTNRLMPPGLAWVQRQHAYEGHFPPAQLVAVVNAPTSELTQRAAAGLSDELQRPHAAILSARQPQGGAYFARTALLFPPAGEVRQATEGLIEARPVIAALAADPTLRGILTVAARLARAEPGRAERPAAMLADTLDAAFAA